MPFIIKRNGDQWCVYTQTKPGGGPKGDPHGCHPTREKALAQMRALYANVPDARMAAFAAELTDAARDGDVVIRAGRLFRCGSYPDKQFAMTAAELAAAADAFQPVPVDLEHTVTLLDGKLGQGLAVWTEAEGEELFGALELPAWLNDALGDGPLPVSCTWDRSSKTLSGIALVTRPRVEDAALMGAYAAFAKRHDTPHGQRAMQEIHDHAASLGAVCSPGNANMASRHEHAAIQSIHDTAVQHGAACAALGNVRQVTALYSNAPTTGGGDRSMPTLWDRLKAHLGGVEDTDPPAGTPAPTATTADFAAERATLTAERDAAKAAAEKAKTALTAAFADRGGDYVTDSVRLGIPKASAEAVVATFAATGDYEGLKTLAEEQRKAAVARFGRGPSANVTAATDDGAGADENPALAAALASAKKTGAAERARNGK